MKKILFTLLILIVMLSACSTQIYDTSIEKPDSAGRDNEIQNAGDDLIEELPVPDSDEAENVNETIVDELNAEQDEEIGDTGDFPIQLSLEKTENSVKLSWTKYEGEFEFVSYKVSRSVTDSNPYYPGHSLRETIPYVNETEYEDLLPERGISYYVVSAIGPLNEKAHSNPVKVEFPDPKETPDQEISLRAVVSDGEVQLSWDRYGGEFLFYKVVHTTKHPYPKYPEDSTIETIAYVNQTEFTHINPEDGLNIYAVTVVRPDKTRFTSERASVEVG